MEGTLNALEFLRKFNFDDKLGLNHDKPKLHGTVIVVGAGNVAMDGARCAVRAGAEKTIILYRRDRSEAPCTPSAANPPCPRRRRHTFRSSATFCSHLPIRR